VSEAIGDGRRAATPSMPISVASDLPLPERREPIGFDKLNLNYFEHGTRARESLLPVELRNSTRRSRAD